MAALPSEFPLQDTSPAVGLRLELPGSPKKWRSPSRDDDELSTSAGSSDAETSGNEDTPNGQRSRDITQSAGYFAHILALLRCARRSTTTLQPSPGSMKDSTKRAHSAKQVSAVCSECSCRIRCNSGGFDHSDKVAPEVEALYSDAALLPQSLSLPEMNPPGLAGFVPPPGLPPPPGLEFLLNRQAHVPPRWTSQVESSPASPASSRSFSPVAFHKELVDILRDLNSDRNTGRAVQRVREQCVPVMNQAAEFADILTRALETKNGMNRRSMIAFCAGLAAAEPSAFDRAQCADGLEIFFQEVYPDLCSEVPKLPALVTTELLPTLKAVLPMMEVWKCVPKFKAR